MLTMSTKVEKWGNSLGVRLPKAVLEMSQIKSGTFVAFDVRNKKIILKPIKKQKQTYLKISMKDILKGYSSKSFDKNYWKNVKPRGNEEW